MSVPISWHRQCTRLDPGIQRRGLPDIVARIGPTAAATGGLHSKPSNVLPRSEQLRSTSPGDTALGRPRRVGLGIDVADQATRLEERGQVVGGSASGCTTSPKHKWKARLAPVRIEPIVVAAGVFVVDAKRYRGRPELGVRGGPVTLRVERCAYVVAAVGVVPSTVRGMFLLR